jgi:hypothetical protein
VLDDPAPAVGEGLLLRLRGLHRHLPLEGTGEQPGHQHDEREGEPRRRERDDLEPEAEHAHGGQAGGDEAPPAGELDSLAGEAQQGRQQGDGREDGDGHDGRGGDRRVCTNVTPMSIMLSSEITTVQPAKTTDRPAVSMAVVTDSRTVWPAWSCSR